MKRAWQRDLAQADYDASGEHERIQREAAEFEDRQQELADQDAGYRAAQAHDAAISAETEAYLARITAPFTGTEAERQQALKDLVTNSLARQARDEILREVFPTDEEVARDYERHGGERRNLSDRRRTARLIADRRAVEPQECIDRECARRAELALSFDDDQDCA